MDLVDPEPTERRAALLAAARGARGKPLKSRSSGCPDQQGVSAGEAAPVPRELPPIWNIPYHPNPYFTGRELLLAEAHAG